MKLTINIPRGYEEDIEITVKVESSEPKITIEQVQVNQPNIPEVMPAQTTSPSDFKMVSFSELNKSM